MVLDCAYRNGLTKRDVVGDDRIIANGGRKMSSGGPRCTAALTAQAWSMAQHGRALQVWAGVRRVPIR